jgi:hypothetical protein
MRRRCPGKNAPAWLRALGCAALVTACSDAPVEGEDAASGTGTGANTTTSASITTVTTVSTATAGETGTTGTDGPTGSDTTFSSLSNVDTTFAEFGESGFDQACRKVDVIFAIDNSGSMAEEIAALTGPVFDSFPAALLQVGNGIDDFHLAVIDACPTPAYYHNTGTGGACNFSTGTNWMVSTSPTLTAEYQCVTALSQSGYNNTPDMCDTTNDDDEQPARAASDSLTPELVSGINAGFLRDDALLLVVAITDEDEELFGGITTDEITQRIIDAKGTIDEVIFLGIGGNSDCEGPYGSADPADNLRTITQTFVDADRGLFWDLCQGNLEAAFMQAIEIVDGVCNDVVPL